MYEFGAIWSMPPLAPGVPGYAALSKVPYRQTMQSAHLLPPNHSRIAPSIREWLGCVFAPSKCADRYQKAACFHYLGAQVGRLIALIEQFPAFFEQFCAAFVAPCSAPANAAPLWTLWWGRS
jgi:hypothetical protein